MGNSSLSKQCNEGAVGKKQYHLLKHCMNVVTLKCFGEGQEQAKFSRERPYIELVDLRSAAAQADYVGWGM